MYVSPYKLTGKIYVHPPSSEKLGRQLEESFEIVSPFLLEMTDNCNISIGSAANRLAKDKDTLVVNASGLKPIKGNFLQKLKGIMARLTPVEIATSQSCTQAVSPMSLALNAVRAKASLFSRDTEEFMMPIIELFSNKETKEANLDYLKRYSTTPNKEQLEEDLKFGSITAMKNGLLKQNPISHFD